jgi:hypothetical protein
VGLAHARGRREERTLEDEATPEAYRALDALAIGAPPELGGTGIAPALAHSTRARVFLMSGRGGGVEKKCH